jgi:hypothetical protein
MLSISRNIPARGAGGASFFVRNLEIDVTIEKPAQVSLRGFSSDGPHVEGLAARTDRLRSLAGHGPSSDHPERKIAERS